MRCRLIKRTLPLHTPLATGGGIITDRTVWAIAISDDQGHTGLGEAAPLAAFGSESPQACREALHRCLGILTADFIAQWLDRGRAEAALAANLEKEVAQAPCARQAIEGALIDLLAQQQERPVATLLAGGAGRREPLMQLPVNALLGGSLADVVEAATQLSAGGFTCFKLKVAGHGNGGLGQDIERVFAVRAAIGPEARLRVDANATWHMHEAMEFAVETGDANLEFCEQPMAANDLEGLANLRRRTGMRIALDESVRTAADIGLIAAAQAADVVVLKPMFLGGWRPTLQAAQLAHSCGIAVVVTTALDGSIGRAHATHYAAALALDAHAHGLATGILMQEDLTRTPLQVVNGLIHLPTQPGLGIGPLRT